MANGLPNVLWMVQYNLAGLQKPYRMKLHDDISSDTVSLYYDKSEDIGGDPIPNNTKGWPVVFDTNDRVAYYFNDKKEVEAAYDMLNRYRSHIVTHI